MDLDLAIQVIAWAMTITPMTVFLVISFYMMYGASEDDEAIKGLIMLGLGIFTVGVILLIATYFTSFSVSRLFGG